MEQPLEPFTTWSLDFVNDVLECGRKFRVLNIIPGAEVMIDGEWIPYSKANETLVKSNNPMDLAWRINGPLLRKYGYVQGQTIEGQIITVDDQWNGLRLEKAFTVTLL